MAYPHVRLPVYLTLGIGGPRRRAAGPRLTIFVRLLPEAPRSGTRTYTEVQARLFAGLARVVVEPLSLVIDEQSGETQCCCRAALTMRRTIARITMLAGVARALMSRGRPRVARPARQLRSSAPLRMAASTLEGLRNVAIVAHVRRSVRKQCQA